jgi:hypothetical protein
LFQIDNPDLVEQILAPLVIGVAHHAHDVAAGVEVERARFAEEVHIGFMGKLVALAAVAAVAAGYEILPARRTAAGAREDVVEREIASAENVTAVLACVAVA